MEIRQNFVSSNSAEVGSLDVSPIPAKNYNIDNYEIVKQLGNGMSGTVYLTTFENKNYALKIQHILTEKLIPGSSDWREIVFSEKFGNKYPDQFMKLYTYDIINNHLKLLKSPIYIKESIPNSVIKKSRKDAYKK